jgi:hypothetical protein
LKCVDAGDYERVMPGRTDRRLEFHIIPAGCRSCFASDGVSAIVANRALTRSGGRGPPSTSAPDRCAFQARSAELAEEVHVRTSPSAAREGTTWRWQFAQPANCRYVARRNHVRAANLVWWQFSRHCGTRWTSARCDHWPGFSRRSVTSFTPRGARPSGGGIGGLSASALRSS